MLIITMNNKNIITMQKAVIPNITKRKYIKKPIVESIVEPKKVEIIISPEVEVIHDENDNNVQNKRINNLIKAREIRQTNINIKHSDKETKINELVEAISKEQIEKIKDKNDKLKTKLLKLI